MGSASLIYQDRLRVTSFVFSHDSTFQHRPGYPPPVHLYKFDDKQAAPGNLLTTQLDPRRGGCLTAYIAAMIRSSSEHSVYHHVYSTV